MKYKQAFDDVLLLEFSAISYYMENEVYKGDAVRKQQFEQKIKTATTYAASCAWMIGCEWAENYPSLHARLMGNIRIDEQDIPSDAMKLLQKAGYLPYWLFASFFTNFYNSRYGQRTRHQKDNHLRDMYKSIMNGVYMCFLGGVQSV